MAREYDKECCRIVLDQWAPRNEDNLDISGNRTYIMGICERLHDQPSSWRIGRTDRAFDIQIPTVTRPATTRILIHLAAIPLLRSVPVLRDILDKVKALCPWHGCPVVNHSRPGIITISLFPTNRGVCCRFFYVTTVAWNGGEVCKSGFRRSRCR